MIVLPWIIYALIFTLGIFGEQKISTVIAWAIQKWMIVVIVAFLVTSKNWIDDAIIVFCGFSLVHVTATVLEFIAPNFIHGLTHILLRANEANETLRLFGFQYHCGIAQQASYNAAYIAVAICIFLPYLFDNFSSKGRWKAAILAAKLLEINVKDGGVLLEGNGLYWLEEYPTTPSSYTLNGFIYSLFGIYDLYQVTNDEKYWNFFEKFMKLQDYGQ